MKSSLIRFLAVAMVLMAALFPLKGEATIIIDFEQASPEGGVINTYNGGTGAAGYFPINMMKVTGAGSMDGTYDVQGALGTASDYYAALYFDTNNYVRLVGSVPSLGVGGPGGSTGNVDLLLGTFTTFTITQLPGGFSLTAGGIDTKNAALLAALGIVGDYDWEFSEFTMSGSELIGAPGYKAISSDVRNATVPEPLTMILLGSGLLGLAVLGRKLH